MKNLSQVSHLQKSSESLTKRAYNNENRPNCCAHTHHNRPRPWRRESERRRHPFNLIIIIVAIYSTISLTSRPFTWCSPGRSFVGIFSWENLFSSLAAKHNYVAYRVGAEQFFFLFCSTRKVRWCRWQSISVFVCSFLMEILCNSAWEAKRSSSSNN